MESLCADYYFQGANPSPPSPFITSSRSHLLWELSPLLTLFVEFLKWSTVVNKSRSAGANLENTFWTLSEAHVGWCVSAVSKITEEWGVQAAFSSTPWGGIFLLTSYILHQWPVFKWSLENRLHSQFLIYSKNVVLVGMKWGRVEGRWFDQLNYWCHFSCSADANWGLQLCFAKEHTASGFSAFLVIAMSIIKLHVAIDALCAASRQSSGHNGYVESKWCTQ